MRSLDESPFVVHKAHLIDTVVYLTVSLLIALAPLCYDIHQRIEFRDINTASASKVGQFRPFLGEVKKLKGPLMSIFLFKYRNVEVQLLRQDWMHFVRDHSTCWMLQMRRYKSGLCR